MSRSLRHPLWSLAAVGLPPLPTSPATVSGDQPVPGTVAVALIGLFAAGLAAASGAELATLVAPLIRTLSHERQILGDARHEGDRWRRARRSTSTCIAMYCRSRRDVWRPFVP